MVATVLITIAIILVVALIIVKLVRDKKAGRMCQYCGGGCSGSCAHCNASSACKNNKTKN